MTAPLLSKSRFLAGLQCELRLWHTCYHRELASEISPVQQAIFDTGHQVGELATRLYPGGVLIEEDHLHHEEAVLSTQAAMGDAGVMAIFEAAFLHDGVRIRVDVLDRHPSGAWNLVEVKSSTGTKDIHVPDVSIQYHVLQGAGLEINEVFLMHLNREYAYDGNQWDLQQLFTRSNMTRAALIYHQQIPERLARFNAMLGRSDPPEILPSRHCRNPYECEFWDHCTRRMPEHWVMELSGIPEKKLMDLASRGIHDIRQVPDTYPMTVIQKRIRDCVLRESEYMAPGLAQELGNVQYPVHFLDFETISPALPRYAGTRPYQRIPFQWSDHILSKDGNLEHLEYLWEGTADPREAFTRSLLKALAKGGTVFTYTGYELNIIRDLAALLPQYRQDLLGMTGRLKDLHAILKKAYYHPAFHGSYSLKAVLPALVPDMDYGSLAIQEGGYAAVRYLAMIDPSTPDAEREQITKELLDYCGFDTLAMVRIREILLKKVQDGSA